MRALATHRPPSCEPHAATVLGRGLRWGQPQVRTTRGAVLCRAKEPRSRTQLKPADLALQERRALKEAQRAQDDPSRNLVLHQELPVTAEVSRLVVLALPILLQYFTANISYLVNTVCVGRLDEPELLSALVLATSLATATGYNVISGISITTESVCGAAYGAKDGKALNETLLRALLICAAACVPIAALWSHAEPLLIALHQPPAVAARAATYLQIVAPALILFAIHDCADRYLISQNITRPSLIQALICTVLTPFLSYYFIIGQGLGLEGAGYAYLALQGFNAALSIGYLAWRETAASRSDHERLRPTMAVFSAGPLKSYAALAVPAIIAYCMEGWACEVLVLSAGTLDNAVVAQGVTGITMQFSTFVWLTAASLASGTAVTVAAKLGAGDAAGAQRTAQIATGTVVASQALVGAVAYYNREYLLKLLSTSAPVIDLSLQVMPALAFCFILDGLVVVQGGVLRGAGRQWWAAGLNLGGWWLLGVPLSYYLATSQNMNVLGLWAGFATAAGVQALMQAGILTKIVDWNAEVGRANALVSKK